MFIYDLFHFLLKKLNEFLKKKPLLTKLLVEFFDLGSKFTHFFLFNTSVFIVVLLMLFFVPFYYNVEFINLFITLLENPKNLGFSFINLPPALFLVLSFYVLLTELVGFCTVLAVIPIIKVKMIEKYNDPLILKKRRYNTPVASLRRVTGIMIPISLAVITAGDVYQHQLTLDSISQANQHVWDEFSKTRDKKILDRLQPIPTGSVSDTLHKITVKFFEGFVEWKGKSKTRD